MVKHNDDGLAMPASARETLVHRDKHAFQFMEADKAPLLQRALPCLDWQVVGSLPALSAPDFRSLLMESCLRLDGDSGYMFGGHCPSLALIAMAWAEIVRIAPEGHVLWTKGQERADFIKALERAVYAPDATAAVPDLAKFRVCAAEPSHWTVLIPDYARTADATVVNPAVPTVAEAAEIVRVTLAQERHDAYTKRVAWLKSLRYALGESSAASLAAEDGSLRRAGQLMYYAGDYMTAAQRYAEHAAYSALGALVKGAALKALAASGINEKELSACGPQALAGACLETFEQSEWPGLLATYTGAAARNTELMSRLAYGAAGGAGPAAERVLMLRLLRIVRYDGPSGLKALRPLLRDVPTAVETKGHVAFLMSKCGLGEHDCLVLKHLVDLNALLAAQADLFASDEYRNLPPPQRMARAAELGPAYRRAQPGVTLERSGEGRSGGGGGREASASGRLGLLQAAQVVAMKGSKEYDVSKKGILQLTADGHFHEAIGAMLRGYQAVDAAGIKSARIRPLLIFKLILYYKCDTFAFDPQLAPLEQLRDHVAHYFGAIALHCLEAPDNITLALDNFWERLRQPGTWAKEPLNFEQAWLEALTAIHGINGFTPLDSGGMYKDCARIMYTRALFIGLTRGAGLADESPFPDEIVTPGQMLDGVAQFYITHSLVTSIAPGVYSVGREVMLGVFAETGAVQQAELNSRDVTIELNPRLVQVASQSYKHFKLEKEVTPPPPPPPPTAGA